MGQILQRSVTFLVTEWVIQPFFCFFREFSSALEFLHLLNNCTEDSSSPRPPFSTPPNHTTIPGVSFMMWEALPNIKGKLLWVFVWAEREE